MSADAPPMLAESAAAALIVPATGMGIGSAELRAAGVPADIWQGGIVLDAVAGRGRVRRVALPDGGYAVVRHYHRGGALARWFGDRYWYSGAEHTRCFSEFRLLEKLQRKGLPVPEPLAARFQRSGPWYRADLAMRELQAVRSLHALLREAHGSLPKLAGHVGTTIGRFHRAGVWHADLNAHNVLVDDASQVFLIDFDRGELRVPRRTWQRANLHRLWRSLQRLGHTAAEAFQQQFWMPLLAAHAQVLR